MKLTQSQFAEIVDLSEDSVGKIERGITMPTIDTLRKMAKGLNIPLSGLLEEKTGKRATKGNALDDLVNYLKTKSQEDVRLIHDVALKVLERKRMRQRQ